LQKHYYPLEVDPTLSLEEKTKFMVEWVSKAHKLLIDNHLSRDNIDNAVKKAVEEFTVALRTNTPEFFALAAAHSVPTLIFSAGIADVLERILKRGLKEEYSNVFVVSNRCNFADDGNIQSFVEPYIHVFNKKAQAYLDTPYFKLPNLHERTNLLLFGDSLGDVTMADGTGVCEDNILRVGFLNDRPERLEQYLQVYDLVILDDPGFDVPLGLLSSICDGTK